MKRISLIIGLTTSLVIAAPDSRVNIKTYFELGDEPTEAQFIDTWDSTAFITENDTITGSWIFTPLTTFTSGIVLGDQNASPTTVGQFWYDNTVTGLTEGALVYHNGTNVRHVVDLATLPVNDDFVVAYDAAADIFYMKEDSTGSGSLGSSLSSTTDDITSTGNLIVELGDAAGVNKFSIADSDSLEVAAIDSNGNMTVGSTVTSSLIFNEKAASVAVAAGEGEYWVQDTTPSTPVFTDDTDTDYPIATQAYVAAQAFQSLVVADLSDAATPSVLTTAETNNRLISNYKGTGADHVFTMPAAHASGNVTFVIGDEFQVDIEPNAGDNFIFNGVAMAADEHIVNSADALYHTIVAVSVNINNTYKWMFKTDSANWAEETP